MNGGPPGAGRRSPWRAGAGSTGRAASASCSSSIRSTTSPVSIGTSRAGCVSRILPRSRPRYRSKSASDPMSTRTTSAVTVPPVPDVQDLGKPMIGMTCGSTR